jgi:hypothetical protein
MTNPVSLPFFYFVKFFLSRSRWIQTTPPLSVCLRVWRYSLTYAYTRVNERMHTLIIPPIHHATYIGHLPSVTPKTNQENEYMWHLVHAGPDENGWWYLPDGFQTIPVNSVPYSGDNLTSGNFLRFFCLICLNFSYFLCLIPAPLNSFALTSSHE